MFGNVIADEMSIYRIGFNDALASIFSKLLDFKICECSGILSSRPMITLVSPSAESNANISNRFIYERTSDGSLWEPIYDGECKVRVNPSHPYFKSMPCYNDNKHYYEFILKLAEYEARLIDDKELKSIESMRINISRCLWIESDVNS